MSEAPFTWEQVEILDRLGKLIGQIFGAYIYTQNRLAGLEELAQGAPARDRRRDRGGPAARRRALA